VGKFVVKDSEIVVNGTDISDHVQSVTVETTTDEVDVTGMTAASYREFADGFKDATVTCTFLQDYAAGEVNDTLWPLYNAGSVFALTIRPQAAGGGQPGGTVVWSLLQARLYNYSPVGGGVGDASTFDATFRNAGTAGLTVGTA
jgi:hypothetical protein